MRRKLRLVLYACSWLFFLSWVYLNYRGDAETSAVLIGLIWAFFLVLWCREDAKLANRPLPTMSIWVLFLFWPIAIPVCVIRLYGVGYGLLLVFLHTVIYCLVFTLPAMVLFMQEV